VTVIAAPLPAYNVGGARVYSAAGEPYAQIPRSLMGLLSKRAQRVLDALLRVLGAHTQTDIRDVDLRELTGLSMRVIQKGLFDLHRVVGAISRTRGGGRRIIELTKKLLDRLPSAEPVPARATAKRQAEATVGPNQRSVEQTRRERAAWVIDCMASLGWEPSIVSGELRWRPRADMDQQKPGASLQSMALRFRADIRALIEQSSPRRE
jgi:hypothetical protein